MSLACPSLPVSCISRATGFTLEYVSRTAGDPGVTRGLGLAQVQVIF